MNDSFERFEKADFYFENAMLLRVLEKLFRSRLERAENGSKNHVDGAVMHSARLDA